MMIKRCLAAICVLLSAACSHGDAVQSAGNGTTAGAGVHPWTRAGVLRYAAPADPRNLNPMLSSSSVTGDLAMFLFSYAVRYNDKAEPVPDALIEIPTVENGDVSKDGLTLIYKLRKNIKWHDGVALTSKDLWFTWTCVMNPHNNVITTDGYKDIASIDHSDPYVAVFHMKKVYAPFLQQIFSENGNAVILPEHLLAKLNDDKGSFNTAAFQSAPIGSGPFKFVSWQRGSSVRMAANPDFYLGRPKLNEVVFSIMPEENTMLTQLRSHEIDMAVHGSGVLWDQYKAIPDTVALHPQLFTYDHIDFNCSHPPFTDVRVRRALDYAIDKKTILDKVYHGLGELAPADESPTLGKAYTPDVARYPFDPVKARSLLDAAGWHVASDGVRTKNGVRLSFNYGTQTESTSGQRIEGLVQRYWHDVGAEAIVKNGPTSLFFDNTKIGTLQGGHYDVASFAWTAAADPDDSAIYSADNLAPGGQNSLFWKDAAATKALNAGLATIDFAKRKADYRIVQQRLASEVPTIVLFFRQEPIVYNSDLKGFTSSPVISPFWNPWEYSI